MGIINKIRGLIKQVTNKGKINTFYLGKVNITIIELYEDSKKVIFNKLLKELLMLNINLFWFNDYQEMESYLDYFLDKETVFVIIN